MKVVIQRVLEAAVHIAQEEVAAIQNGLVILVGIEEADQQEDINWLCAKIANLRIFGDENNIMNLSINRHIVTGKQIGRAHV